MAKTPLPFLFAAPAFYFTLTALLLGSSSDLGEERRISFGILRNEPSGLVVFGEPQCCCPPRTLLAVTAA